MAGVDPCHEAADSSPSGGEDVFVLMPGGSKDVQVGETVSIEAIVLRTPESRDSRFDSLGDPSTDEVYVYATKVS